MRYHVAFVLTLGLVSFMSSFAFAQDTSASDKQTQPRGFDFSVNLGGLTGVRSLSVTGQDPVLEEHSPNPYVGVAGELEAFFFHPSNDMSLGVSFESAFGVSSNRETSMELGRAPSTRYVLFAGQLRARRALTPHWFLDLGLGANATSFLVEANARYTGHRYIQALASLAVEKWWAGHRVLTGVRVAFLPGIDTNESDYASKDVQTFGLNAGVDVGFRFGSERKDPFQIRLRYTFQRFRSVYADAPRFGPSGAVSEDNQHFISLVGHYGAF